MLMPTMGGGKLAHYACPACGGRSEVGGNCGLLGPVGWMYFSVAGVRMVGYLFVTGLVVGGRGKEGESVSGRYDVWFWEDHAILFS